MATFGTTRMETTGLCELSFATLLVAFVPSADVPSSSKHSSSTCRLLSFVTAAYVKRRGLVVFVRYRIEHGGVKEKV